VEDVSTRVMCGPASETFLRLIINQYLLPASEASETGGCAVARAADGEISSAPAVGASNKIQIRASV